MVVQTSWYRATAPLLGRSVKGGGMSAQVKGALIIGAAILVATFGAAYMLSPERDVERCVRLLVARPVPIGVPALYTASDPYAVCFLRMHFPEEDFPN